MSTPKHILIAGAGIAGPALALMLARDGHEITIVERAPSIRLTGQQVDVAGQGVGVVKALGVWDQLLARTVGDKGIRFIDSGDRVWAAFAADKESGANSFVKEIEILRGEMAEVLCRATRDGVEYLFDNTITALSETDSGIAVTISSLAGQRDFDLVVAADGIYSSTRSLAFGRDFAEVRSLNQCLLLMTIPWQPSHGEWSRWFNAPGGRCVSTRPQPRNKQTGAYLAVMSEESREIARMGVVEQKAKVKELFADVGWEARGIVEQIDGNESVDVQETAQVHAPYWTKGRVALVGGAAYCPSGVSGQGTTLAFAGAYILAGCLCTYDDIPTALREYEEQVRPFVEKAQKLIPGVPGVANPQTAWGIKGFYSFMWMAEKVNSWGVAGAVTNLLSPLTGFVGKDKEIPRFPAMKLEI
ncbi:hypothetical protein LTR86_001143 [Recurvomyces mirabilis]|nr:hypothetical protein LTR86_001143 [Recurvomyces mirabilis]